MNSSILVHHFIFPHVLYLPYQIKLDDGISSILKFIWFLYGFSKLYFEDAFRARELFCYCHRSTMCMYLYVFLLFLLYRMSQNPLTRFLLWHLVLHLLNVFDFAIWLSLLFYVSHIVNVNNSFL